ncbi:hypothetical protein KAW96_05005 [candidate division WOR-3 bacterium]|nr:hypothetical protein [candidate division WOR-3 bacterium]
MIYLRKKLIRSLVKNFSLSTAYSSLATAVSWDGRDDFGKLLPSGIYYCKRIII